MMKKRTSRRVWAGGLCLMVVLAMMLIRVEAWAHCQIPCGIYDDAARVARLKEDTVTIAKSVAKIGELAGGHDAQALNQLVRWVTNKEQHADHIIEVVSHYFLAQRVKPVAADGEGHGDYLARLADHHAVIVAAMKAKQNANQGTVDALNEAIDKMGQYYK